MAGTTPIYGLPYPQSSDLVSAYPALGQDLAEDLDGILAAKADYPSGGSNGDLLTKSGTTTAWAAPSVAGLTLIAHETFTAVSAVNINNCFSSTYDNYRLLVDITSVSTSLLFGIRLRVSGSDNTGSNYTRQNVFAQSSTIGAQVSTNTSFSWGSMTARSSLTYDFFGPNKTAATRVVGHFANDSGGIFYVSVEALSHSLSTAYTGLSLVTDTGNMTGQVRVYGYRNS